MHNGSIHWRNLLLPLFLLAAMVVATAKKPADSSVSPTAGSIATFKSTSRLVQLDIVVTDLSGQFASRLTKDDFNVFEDGKPQRIISFEGPDEHPRNPYSNDQAPVTILILDELNTAFPDMATARNQLVRYLRTQPEHLGQPTTLIVIDDFEFKVLQSYTRDRDALLLALKNHLPRYPAQLKNGIVTDRLASSLVALQQIAASTMGIPARKNVIWLGAGYPAMNLVGLQQDLKTSIEDQISRTINKLLEARITVYSVDPTMMDSLVKSSAIETEDENLAVYPNQTLNHELIPNPFDADVSLAALGPATGGRSYYWRNDLDKIIQSSVDDGAKYYTVAYVPSNRTDIPKYRAIRVKLRRGLIARTRDGYYSIDVPPTSDMVSVDVSQAAKNTMSYTGLPVTLTGRAAQGNAYCTLYIDAHALSWQPMPNGDSRATVRIGIARLSGKNKLLAYDVKEMASITPARYFRALMDTPVALRVQARLPHGVQRLRFVVRDESTGHMGAVDVDTQNIPADAPIPRTSN